MSPSVGCAPPSAAAADLIRAAAKQIVDDHALLDTLDRAISAITGQDAADDPVLRAGLRQSSRSNLVQWATANIRDPGLPVTANIAPGTLEIGRDVVRRGIENDAIHAYWVRQTIIWRHWMDTVFALTSDPALVREVLEITSRSLAVYGDATLAGIRAQVDREREQLLSGIQAERLQTVSLILDGAPIDAGRASTRLRYELARPHAACIVWADAPGAPHAALERTAGILAHAAGAHGPLTVAPSTSVLWAWFSPDTGFDAHALRDLLPAESPIRVALGSALTGIDGFRRSHHEAAVAQRLMCRMPSPVAFARYRDVHLVAVAAQDEADAATFVQCTIGDLATAEPQLRETLRCYIREQFNATRTAAALFTHRNTILTRVARAERLMPAPLADRGVEVGLALEIVYWLGVPA